MKTPVVLTGATGYLGSQILNELLMRGYAVRITSRNPKKTIGEEWLKPFFKKYNDKLEVFYADLTDDGSFDEVMRGAKSVIHTASPFKIQGIKNAQKELVDPAKKGTRNVIQSAENSNTVKKIVVTSSVAAVYGDAADIHKHEESVFSEKHWNTTSNVNHQPYSYSKTEAEKEAWRLAKDKSWSLATINPGFIIGPSITDRGDSTSIQMIINMLNGKFKQGVPDLYFSMVDVRDVAKAHVEVLEKDGAAGRYICTNETMGLLQLTEKLDEQVGDRYSKIPGKKLPKFMTYMVGPFMAGFSWNFLKKNLGIPVYFSNEKIKSDLDIQFRPIEETLKEHVEQLEKDGLIGS